MFDTGASYIITYFSVMIVSFLGIYIGCALGYISPEELKPGRKYFNFIAKLFPVIALGLILFAYDANLIVVIALCITLLIFLNILGKGNSLNQILYFVLGASFFLSTKSLELFLSVGVIAFLTGLPLGSIYVAEHIKQSKATVLSDLILMYGFFIVCVMMSNLIGFYIGGV